MTNEQSEARRRELEAAHPIVDETMPGPEPFAIAVERQTADEIIALLDPDDRKGRAAARARQIVAERAAGMDV